MGGSRDGILCISVGFENNLVRVQVDGNISCGVFFFSISREYHSQHDLIMGAVPCDSDLLEP